MRDPLKTVKKLRHISLEPIAPAAHVGSMLIPSDFFFQGAASRGVLIEQGKEMLRQERKSATTCSLDQSLLAFRRNQTAGTSPVFRIRPTTHAGLIPPGNFSDNAEASADLDNCVRRFHEH